MNSSEATLYTLALRLIATHYGPPPQDDMQLLVAQVPEGVLRTVPMPERSHLLGSLTRTHQVMVVLDVDLHAERVIDFYRHHFAAADWLDPTANQPMPGGFQRPQIPRALHLWQGPHGPTLSIQVYELRDRPADVRLTLNTDPTLSLEAQDIARRGPMIRHGIPPGIIPPLWPPANADILVPRGGSSGPESVESAAVLVTELDLAAVTTHYAGQLQQAGWALHSESQIGPVRCSNWFFPNEAGHSCQGLFVVQQRVEHPEHYFLNVRADWAASG
jgi:hypothetical protein